MTKRKLYALAQARQRRAEAAVMVPRGWRWSYNMGMWVPDRKRQKLERL